MNRVRAIHCVGGKNPWNWVRGFLVVMMGGGLLSAMILPMEGEAKEALRGTELETKKPFILEAFPSEVILDDQRATQGFVVRITEQSGVHRDVTAEASFTFRDPRKARMEGGVAKPVGDGETTLKVSYRGQSTELPVRVSNAQVTPVVSFRRDVMPVFLRSGCNSGSCHGSARGQDGFRLSLFGYDPEGDHFRLTREFAGRRINLALPEESMVITKCVGEAPHTGGNFSRKRVFMRRH